MCVCMHETQIACLENENIEWTQINRHIQVDKTTV